MNWQQISRRLTGLTIGPVGASWKATRPDTDVAQEVINFFEDRRVLFNPYELEIPQHCVDSVHMMRQFLTGLLSDRPPGDSFGDTLRAMRAACTRFIEEVEQSGRRIIIESSYDGGPNAWVFFSALGELRPTIGLHLAVIATRHRLSIPEPLSKILPPEDQ